MILELGSVSQWNKYFMVWDCVGGGNGHSAAYFYTVGLISLHQSFSLRTLDEVDPASLNNATHFFPSLPGLERHFTADILISCVIPLRPLFTLEIRRIDLSTIQIFLLLINSACRA